MTRIDRGHNNTNISKRGNAVLVLSLFTAFAYIACSRNKLKSGAAHSSTPLLLCRTFILFNLALLERSHLRNSIRRSQAAPFTLVVSLMFKTDESLNQFQIDFKPLGEYVNAHETGTLTYVAMQSDKNPLMVTILERYEDKEKAFLEVHRSSELFLAFRPKLSAMAEAGRLPSSDNVKCVLDMCPFP